MTNSTIITDSQPELTITKYVTVGSVAGGNGSVMTPYVAVDGDLDPVFALIASGTTLHILAGNYTTKGWAVPASVAIIGSGMDQTIITLKSNAITAPFYPAIRMFSPAPNQWSTLFIAKDLTLDCNWSGQTTGLTLGNFKIEAIQVQCFRAKVENVRVRNFGADGTAYGLTGLECFPIALHTFSNGLPNMYDPIYTALIGNEPTTFLEIVGCEVTDPHFVHGGYCTAIFVNTNQPGAGDRQVQGLRTTNAALVRGCYVSVPGGIAYGCAESEQVQFEGNVAVDSKCGFNHDTGKAIHVRIAGNQFWNLSQGINFTPGAGSSDVEVTHNVFQIAGPFYNSVLGAMESSYVLNTGSFTVNEHNNIVQAPCVQHKTGAPVCKTVC